MREGRDAGRGRERTRAVMPSGHQAKAKKIRVREANTDPPLSFKHRLSFRGPARRTAT